MNKRIKIDRKNKLISFVLLFSMLLSVICVFPSYAEGEATERSLASGSSLADGVYVFNNRLTGEFLASPGSSFGMLSGQMTNIGSDVQFSVRYVAGGCYDIRLTSRSYYLTRSSTSLNVVLQPTLDMNYSLWKIETYTYSGYTYHYFRNAYTNEYLTWQNGTLKVVPTRPTAGTEAFYACSWRVAKYADYVEPTTITFNNMILPYNTVGSPTVQATPSNADLCAPYDFTYTADTTYVNVNKLEGKFAIRNNTTGYKTYVMAQHKPTGLLYIFTITTDIKGTFVGVYAGDDHEHEICLQNASDNIGSNSDHSSPTVVTGAFTSDMIDSYLDSNENGIFISRSHGTIEIGAGDVHIGTQLQLSHYNNTSDYWYKSSQISTSKDFSNIRIAVFGACYTGAGGSNGMNLPSVAVERGAKVAIGFQGSVNCYMASSWVRLFVDYLLDGDTVQEAIDTIGELKYYGTAYKTLLPYVAGDGTVTLI